MQKKLQSKKSNQGQAITEMMISVGVLGSVLIASVALYQVMHADLTANKAARLATWHGVLYQSLTPEEFDDRSSANIHGTLLENEITDPLDREGIPLLEEEADIDYSHNAVDPTYTYPSNRSTYIANRAGLNNNTISTVTLSIPLSNESQIFDSMHYVNRFENQSVDHPLPYDSIADEYRHHVKAKAVLLSNGFVPMSEPEFTEAISRISADGQPMTVFEVFRGALDFLGFDEIDEAMGEEGLSTVAQDQSRVLPPQLGTFND